MESFFSRFKNPLVLIAILLMQTVALAIQVRRPENATYPDGQRVRLVRLWAQAIVSPFERLSVGTGHGIRSAWATYIDLRHTHQQNVDLQHQLAQLRTERAAISEDALEAQRLRTLLDFRQHYIQTTVAAQVIGTSGSEQSRLILLDKGANYNLRPGMPVITPDGVVGHLRDVFPSTSQLLLLNDPTSGAGVLLQSTRIRAVLRGSLQGVLVINNLTSDSRIKPGEKVLTSGGDQVFPRGLAVGTIESVRLDPEHQPYTSILLKPAANLNRLEEVLVITSTGDSLDPRTVQELAADAAAHTADLNASRLPSLHDKPSGGDAASPDANAAPGLTPLVEAAPPSENSTSLIPKPKPVLHPDRYSTGSAPPAASLTPGGKANSDQPGPPQP